MSNEIVSYQPTNVGDLRKFAEMLSQSGIVPQPYRNKPNDVFAACLWGWETAELTPMTALAYIHVIQGRAAYTSEGLVAIALRKGYITDVEEEFVGAPGSDEYAAVCTVTKRNGRTLTRRFSVADAKAAEIYGKDNWKKWLDRMLIARARGFAVRDAAPHAMLSLSAEEVHDFGPENVGPDNARVVTPRQQQPAAPPRFVEVRDAWGMIYALQPGEVEQWIIDAIDGASEDELTELAAHNPDNPDIQAAVVTALASVAKEVEQPPPPIEGTSKADEAHRRFMEALAKVHNLTEAAELDAKLLKSKRLLGWRYAECAAAMQAKVAALTGKGPSGEPETFDDDIAHLEDASWQKDEGRVDDPRQPELLGKEVTQ